MHAEEGVSSAHVEAQAPVYVPWEYLPAEKSGSVASVLCVQGL